VRKLNNFWQSPKECREILDAAAVADWVMTWVTWFDINNGFVASHAPELKELGAATKLLTPFVGFSMLVLPFSLHRQWSRALPFFHGQPSSGVSMLELAVKIARGRKMWSH
jgi:hypothetical protein